MEPFHHCPLSRNTFKLVQGFKASSFAEEDVSLNNPWEPLCRLVLCKDWDRNRKDVVKFLESSLTRSSSQVSASELKDVGLRLLLTQSRG